ncbi:MAG: hypothetical protein KDI46_04045 [Alphaproteobacteria bacterium]|nr:hypothetical protein [Alphaproteobacteria bacterium]
MRSETPVELSIKVQKGFFSYVTPSMFITVGVLFFLVFTLRERLVSSFQTSVQLNSVIVLVIVYAIFKAFHNNYRFYNTARFLRRIERLEESPDDIAEEEIRDLGRKLETQGSLLNIQNMYSVLENLSVYGHLNFTDNDARLIKSKFGARVRHDRGVVSYFAGILVMLGLIGTFWGLLGTINSVGDAMGAVSESFSNSGGEANIGEFIGSISKPLQGMGVAFSSSLFGLSGSLFLGFLNFFCGQAQNQAIEEISRWIDHRIPKLNPALKDKAAGKKVPQADDLKAWLAGFVYLSGKANQKMGQLVLSLSKSTDAMMKSAAQTKKVYDYQRGIYTSLENLGSTMVMVKDTMQTLAQNIDPSMHVNSSIRDNLVQIRTLMDSSKVSNDAIAAQQLEQTGKLTSQMHEVHSAFTMLSSVQSSLVTEIEKLQDKFKKEDNAAEFSNLVWQLNTILEDIRQQNKDAYMGIFDNEPSDDDVDASGDDSSSQA